MSGCVRSYVYHATATVTMVLYSGDSNEISETQRLTQLTTLQPDPNMLASCKSTDRDIE